MEITMAMLTEALRQWELDARAGKCRPVEEALSLSVDQRTDEAAAHLWNALSQLVLKESA